MKKKVIHWFMKIAWPVIKFLIINFGREIVLFVFESIKQKTEEKSILKQEEALEKARNAEKQAEDTSDPELKVKFYDLAKRYQDEAAYQERFLRDFIENMEEAAIEVMETVQQKSSGLEMDDVLIVDKKRGTLEAVKDLKIIESVNNDAAK